MSANQDRAVTMEDVAARAGVSRALVSIVMRGVPGASDENRARVTRAAAELSYRPDQRARLLGRSRSRTLGLSFGLHDENHADLVEAFYGAAESRGYDLILSPSASSRSEAHAAQSLRDYRCEALLLIGSSLTTRELEALAEGVPVVAVSRTVRSATVDSVRTDDTTGARLAVEHLVGLGHERIAHVHSGRVAGAAERRNGYRRAMRHAGLDADIMLVAGGRTENDGWRAADTLLADSSLVGTSFADTSLVGGRTTASGATAVFAYNDQCAAGVIAGLRHRGVRVPGEVSVVGYDDTRVASSPLLSLTTVAQDPGALAGHAVDLAIARSEAAGSRAQEIIVAPRLVVRSTTARIG